MTGLKRPLRPPDWSDTHVTLIRAPLRSDLKTARAAYEVALGQMPFWVRGAMKLRNRIVGRLGLATPTMGGGMAGLPIVSETTEAYELGLIDRHLTFTLQTICDGDYARLMTRIWFNHWTGRLYLALVLIPHKIVVKLALRRLA